MCATIRIIPFVFSLALFSFSSPAFACDPKNGANCRGLSCTQQQLGTTVLDHDKQHIIACLASAYGGYVWKVSTNEVGTDIWIPVSFDTSPFDPLCEYRVYFGPGGFPGGGYLLANHVGNSAIFTGVSSRQHALGKVLATDKTKWFYTMSGYSGLNDCYNPSNSYACDPMDNTKCVSCESTPVNVTAIYKRCMLN